MSAPISRRQFTKLTLAGSAALLTSRMHGIGKVPSDSNNPIRLGGPVWGDLKDPCEWVKSIKAKGYSAPLCPVSVGANCYVNVDGLRSNSVY